MHDENAYVEHPDKPDESFPVVLYSANAEHRGAGSDHRPDRMGW